jgi:hypothetical protein
MNSQFLRLNLKDLGHALLAGILVSIVPVLNILSGMINNKDVIDINILINAFVTAFLGWLGTKFFINEKGTLGAAK